MKIESSIKHRDGKPRFVDIHGTRYTFEATKDKYGKVHYVADVDNEEDAATFLSHTHFSKYDPELAPKPNLARTSVKAPVPPKEAEVFSPDVIAEASALIKKSPAAISIEVGTVSGLEVVRAAIELENAQAKPRKNVIDVLERTVEYATQAGNKD